MNSSEMLNLIKTRRSCRAYRTDNVPEELLDKVLEAGTYAPTGGGRQSPVIVSVRDPELRSTLSAMNAGIMGSDSDPYYGAPVVILVLAKGDANTFVEDGSCVLENMMLAATELGLGSCFLMGPMIAFANPEVRARLGLPEGYEPLIGVALGYAAGERPAAPERERDNITWCQ